MWVRRSLSFSRAACALKIDLRLPTRENVLVKTDCNSFKARILKRSTVHVWNLPRFKPSTHFTLLYSATCNIEHVTKHYADDLDTLFSKIADVCGKIYLHNVITEEASVHMFHESLLHFLTMSPWTELINLKFQIKYLWSSKKEAHNTPQKNQSNL